VEVLGIMAPGNDLKARVDFFADWDYNIKIAGVSFRQEELGKLYGRDWNAITISLVEEPDNKYDPNAIKIIADDMHIGYIPGMVAPHVKELLNNGQKFESALMYITSGKKIRTGKIALRRS